jgi:hypothetical protein
MMISFITGGYLASGLGETHQRKSPLTLTNGTISPPGRL